MTDDGWEITMGRDVAASSFATADAPFSQRLTFAFEHEDRTTLDPRSPSPPYTHPGQPSSAFGS